MAERVRMKTEPTFELRMELARRPGELSPRSVVVNGAMIARWEPMFGERRWTLKDSGGKVVEDPSRKRLWNNGRAVFVRSPSHMAKATRDAFHLIPTREQVEARQAENERLAAKAARAQARQLARERVERHGPKLLSALEALVAWTDGRGWMSSRDMGRLHGLINDADAAIVAAKGSRKG